MNKLLAAMLFALVCPAVAAQPPGAHDPIAEQVFPPELVMENQQAIGLTDAQRGSIRNEVRQAQRKLTDLQWQLQDEVEKLVALLKPAAPDEARALAQLDRVLAVERDIKREHMTLMIRLKDGLTGEQQAKLRELRGGLATR
jgi:Spy/CpxP family protein refolding chaperone